MTRTVFRDAVLSFAFAAMASHAHAQHPDESLAEPARRFEATLTAVGTPEARRSAIRELLRKAMFAGTVGKGPDGADAVFIFTRSAYASEFLEDISSMRLALVAGVAVSARDRKRGLWVNPDQPSAFFLSADDLVEAFEANPDLEPPPAPTIVIR